MKFKLLLVFSFLFLINSFATEPFKPTYTATPPKIDGILDDAVWKNSLSVTGFKTFIPDFGKDLSEDTRVYLAYDKENIYFAFKCYDREPDKIKASLTSRDNIRPEDWVCINLDSFNDQQGLYCFYVNPLGVQADAKFTGNYEDEGIDLVWYSAGKIDPDGYTVEIQIPLKSIRYADTNPVQMAVFLERKISRRAEQGSIPHLDPDKGYAFMTQLQPMYYYDVEHYSLFEVLPALTFGQKYKHSAGKLKVNEVNRDASLTLKYGLTSDLILDGTYNPDFSQVEADAGQVDINLRYGLFYAEKRPFFLEGRENFWVAGTGITELDPVGYIVHTRTINNPITGVKLSGKLDKNNVLAAIYAVDEKIDVNPGESRYSHFPIVRYKHTFSDESFLGAILSSREDKNIYNRVAGFDGFIRLTKSSLVEFNGLYSNSKSPVSDVTNGYSYGIKYGLDTRDYELQFTVKDVAENFQADMGYITRTGVQTFSGLYKPKFYPGSKLISRLDCELFSAQTKDKIFNKWETFNHISALAYLFGNIQFKVKYSYSNEIFLDKKYKTGGVHILFGGWFTNNFNFSVLYRNVNSIYYSNNPFQGKSNKLTLGVVYKPTEKIQGSVDFIYNDLYKTEGDIKVYDYPITRFKLTYMANKYLFFRAIAEYNDYRKQMTTDFLASFTYIPGTVIHVGYGSRYEKAEWADDRNEYITSTKFLELQRGFFCKASYLWRL